MAAPLATDTMTTTTTTPAPRPATKAVTISASVQRHLDVFRQNKLQERDDSGSGGVSVEELGKASQSRTKGEREETADNNIHKNEFTYFPKLSAELRAKVFKDFHDTSVERDGFRVVELSQGLEGFRCISNGFGYPEIMKINKEGRQEALKVLGYVELKLGKKYIGEGAVCNGDNLGGTPGDGKQSTKKPPQSLFVIHPGNDILFIQPPKRFEDTQGYLAAVEKLLQQGGTMDKIRCVGISLKFCITEEECDGAKKKVMWVTSSLKLLRQFSSLELIYFVFPDDYFTASSLQAPEGRNYTFGPMKTDAAGDIHIRFFNNIGVYKMTKDSIIQTMNALQDYMARGPEFITPHIEIVRKISTECKMEGDKVGDDK